MPVHDDTLVRALHNSNCCLHRAATGLMPIVCREEIHNVLHVRDYCCAIMLMKEGSVSIVYDNSLMAPHLNQSLLCHGFEES
eukprot:scaffold23995_cov19-Prasinocladus_malaysianus.AAC.1